MDGNSTLSCPSAVLEEFSERVDKQMWQANGLVLLNTVVMVVVVMYQGGNPVFLQIVSTVAGFAMIDPDSSLSYEIKGTWVTTRREAYIHNVLFSVWVGLIIYVGISTAAIIGRNTTTVKELLLQVIWGGYLMSETLLLRPAYFVVNKPNGDSYGIPLITTVLRALFGILVASTLSKLYQKIRVVLVALSSFQIGRNPGFIVSYMARLDGSQAIMQVEEHVLSPPSLIVMEGGTMILKNDPRGGYSFESGMLGFKQSGYPELVTLDRVWRFDDYRLIGMPLVKDLCVSFSLMKLLRCRFKKYTVSEICFTKASNFFWQTYLWDKDYSRVFRVIRDELSFFYGYFFSSTSIIFFYPRFLFARVFNQILSIGCCIYIFVFIKQTVGGIGSSSQVKYTVKCEGREGNPAVLHFGYLYFVLVPLYFVLAAILVFEIRETVSYLCSNFIKVLLICNHVIGKIRCRKFVAFVFKYLRCEWLLNNWDDKMSQCKLLVLHPWEVSILFRRLFRLPNQKKIKVPSEVKEAIFKALQGCRTPFLEY